MGQLRETALPPAGKEERAEASARYALELDPTSSEALGVLAAIVSWSGDPLRAAGLFERALELGNRDPNVLHWHAMLFTSLGYFEGLLPMLQDGKFPQRYVCRGGGPYRGARDSQLRIT